MATLFIFLLLLLGIIFLIFKSNKTALTILILTLLGFLAVGGGWVPKIFLKHLEPTDLLVSTQHWADKNVIVLLGSGTVKVPALNFVGPTVLSYSRINKTASLYFQCKASGHQCTIIISGGDAAHTGLSEAAVYKKELVDLTVNPADIQLESRSMNTYKNAEFTSALIKQGQFQEIKLVTSAIHIKRALLYFSNFGIKATPVLSDYIDSLNSILPIGYNFVITDFAIHEYLGILRLSIYNHFGWNKAVALPGSL